MAATFCTKCGFELEDGQRFCDRCGADAARRKQPDAPVREVAPASAAVPPPAVASAPTDAGGALSDKTIKTASVSSSEGRSREASTPPPAVKVAPVAPPQETPKPVTPEKRPPDKPLSTAGDATVLPVQEARRINPSSKRRAFSGVLAGALGAMLVVAMGAFAFYQWHAKDVESRRTAAISGGIGDTNLKPSAAWGSHAPVPSESHIPVQSGLHGETIVGIGKAASSRRPAPEPVPVPVPAPEPAPTPAPVPVVREPPSSGVLRYSGPPLHTGETTVFNGLPGAMLRFSFDHAVWQPRISHLPDGSQTLVLRSLSKQVQTSCEVRWEIAR